MSKDREKMEKVGKYIAHVLKIERSEAEVEKKGARGFEEKERKKSSWLSWKLIVQVKERKNVSIMKLGKRKKEKGLTIEEEKNLREPKKECLTCLEDWENFRNKK